MFQILIWNPKSLNFLLLLGLQEAHKNSMSHVIPPSLCKYKIARVPLFPHYAFLFRQKLHCEL